jgi:hypothetical protein
VIRALLSAALLAAAAADGGAARGISEETARTILWSITALGAIWWLLLVWGYARIAGVGPNESEEFDPARGGARFISTRARVVGGAPADVADGLERALSSPSHGRLPLTVERDESGGLSARPMIGPYLRAVPTFTVCSVELRPVGEDTDVAYHMDFTEVRRRAIVAARILLGLSLALLIALPLTLFFLAAGSSNPEVRYQVIQAAHVVHLLWPPLLVYALYRRGRRGTEIMLDKAANDASALAEAFAAKRAKGAAGEAAEATR